MGHGNLVVWYGKTVCANRVWTGDVAMNLGEGKFAGVHGRGFACGEVFFESDTEYRELTPEEEASVLNKMSDSDIA